jgi:hypothetical protein
MPTEQYPFIGALDLDTPIEVFKRGFLSDARNVIFRNGRYENMPGTRALTVPLPAGTNGSIGAKYDINNHRIFDFNWNSNGDHAIYVTDTLTEVTETVISDGTVLAFDADFPISSIDILYGDEVQGDVLYWINSQGVFCQININQALNGDYGSYRASYLNVIKEPASIPPGVVYEDDATVTVNNLRKQLFVFKTQPQFNNYDRSVWSAWSEVPLPIDASDPQVDADPTKNSVIVLAIQTGPPNVKQIRIGAAIGQGTAFGDFFEIDLLDKATLGIPDDDIYLYRFRNDQAYIDINVPESTLEYDRIPLKAGAMVLLNGDTPAVGDITEGYDNLSSLGNTAATAGVEEYRRTQPKVLFQVAQNGNSIGTAGDNIHAVVAGTITAGDSFSIYTTNYIINYIAFVSDTPALVITGLAAAATSAGFTVVSSDANNLYISQAAQQLIRYLLEPFNEPLGANDASFAFDWWSREALALTYFDGEGRTNGSQITTGLTFVTLGYSESVGGLPEIPLISASIYHQPPVWAKYYEWVRTKNLSKSKILQWISDRTFKDDIASADGYLYAYISIENLNQYIKDKPAAAFLAYDFAPNDRIRFIKLYPFGADTTPVIETDKDYQIQQQVLNPVINGIQYQGQFLKIYLPATDEFFDFGQQYKVPTLNKIDYSNYFIELYTPAVSATENLNTYYEFSERYAIGNPGTSTRFHQGMLQNQSPDYSLPATFEFSQGDFYVRWRTIHAAPELVFSFLECDLTSDDIPPVNLDSGFNSAGYTAKSCIQADLPVDPAASDNWIINITDGQAYTFNIKGNLHMRATNNSSVERSLELIAVKADNTQTSITLFATATPITEGTVYDVVVDTQFVLTAGYVKVFVVTAGFDDDFILHISSGVLTITDANRIFDQLVIDPNFSDSFHSAVNSNGRPWVFNINARQTRFPVMMRYGLNYEVDTNINNSNRFYPQNFDTYNNTYGNIVRFTQYGKELRVYQYRKCGSVGVYARWVKQQDGSNQLITSDTIITQNNIYYLQGEFGIGNQSMGLAHADFVDYFPDPVKGYLCRRSLDGVTAISDLYKAQTWAGNNLPPYLNSYPYAYGGYAKILGVFQFNKDRSGDYLCYAQGAMYGLYNLASEALVFNEQDNMFRAKVDQVPDMVVCGENKLYSWQAGQMYVHDNTDAYGTFYGTPNDAVVDFPLREPDSVNKSQTALAYAAPYPQYMIDVPKWIAPNMGDVSTSLGQISNLIDEDFEFENGMYHGALQTDYNSPGGVNDGDQLQGLWLRLRLSNSSQQLTWLSNVYLNYLISQRNF